MASDGIRHDSERPVLKLKSCKSSDIKMVCKSLLFASVVQPWRSLKLLEVLKVFISSHEILGS